MTKEKTSGVNRVVLVAGVVVIAVDGEYVEEEGHTGRLRAVVEDEGKGLVEVE